MSRVTSIARRPDAFAAIIQTCWRRYAVRKRLRRARQSRLAPSILSEVSSGVTLASLKDLEARCELRMQTADEALRLLWDEVSQLRKWAETHEARVQKQQQHHLSVVSDDNALSSANKENAAEITAMVGQEKKTRRLEGEVSFLRSEVSGLREVVDALLQREKERGGVY